MWILILCMAVVTFLPRVLPGFLIGKLCYGRRVEKFLRLIPYTAMTALIVPGVFSVDATYWWIGAVGALVAVALSCVKRMPLAVTVLASVASVMLMYRFF
jgi:branched-subunit amino acid transport protein